MVQAWQAVFRGSFQTFWDVIRSLRAWRLTERFTTSGDRLPISTRPVGSTGEGLSRTYLLYRDWFRLPSIRIRRSRLRVLLTWTIMILSAPFRSGLKALQPIRFRGQLVLRWVELSLITVTG